MKNKDKYKILYKLSRLLRCDIIDLQKLSNEQVLYINHYLKQSSFLKACPGSGKTEVVGVKAAYEMHRWNKVSSGIAVVTFTTSAAKELNDRIRKFGAVSSESFPHFIGTFDSWIHNYILQPFCHYLTGYLGVNGDKSMRLIDEESSAGFLSNYTTEIFKNRQKRPVKVTEYYYDHEGFLQGQNERIDNFLKSGISQNETKSLLDNKKKFIRAGFVTYADTEWLCIGLFTKYSFLLDKLSERFPVIIVDECQDLSNGQIKILELLRSKATSLHFVGDLNQSIYEFRKVNPQDIDKYIQNSGFKILQLTNNYRSCQPIVDVVENVIGSPQPIKANEIQICPQPCLLWQYDNQSFAELPQKFDVFLKANGLERKDSAILARGKTTISSFQTQRDKYSFSKSELMAIAFYCWYKPSKNREDLNNALFYIGRALCLLAYNGQGNPRNQYCPEVFEHVEWRLILKSVLESGNTLYPFIDNGGDITWTNWIPKLKVFLQTIWPRLVSHIVAWDDAKRKIISPSGKANNLVKDIYSQPGKHNPLRTTTIHSVKGETLSAVLLVSHHNKQSNGGHFSHWLREGNYDPEHIRFAYVAMSRPKHVLVVATPKLNNADLTKLQKLGFVNQ